MSNWFKSLFKKKEASEVKAPVAPTLENEPVAEPTVSTSVEAAPEEAKEETKEEVKEETQI